MNIAQKLAKDFSIQLYQVENTIKLIDEGNTIPFIARYRKEATGSLDDTVLREFYDKLTYQRNLEKRKEEITESITAQGLMTDEIFAAIEKAEILTEVEDIYRPFRPKRKTRASIARQKGLEPLAKLFMDQEITEGNIEDYAKEYISEENAVNSAEEAIQGASDIIAEDICDNAEYRKAIRNFISTSGKLASKKSDKDGENAHVYEMYAEYEEEISKIPSHRILAVNRGEKEEYLKVSVKANDKEIIDYLKSKIIIKKSIFEDILSTAVEDSYARLIFPSVEREIRAAMTESASEKAISVFAQNLKNLLLTPPLKGKNVLGFDPGYRTGCKLAAVDNTGKVLKTGVIYLIKSDAETEKAKKTILDFIYSCNINVIAIGNGTASKESEIFISSLIKENNLKTRYIMVNEAGASVYSASKLAAAEFPDYDVTLRSAVSIARRLQDPLSELVKIDPKSIGVGQYQHDMKPARLSETLGGIVEDSVNSVGVDLNTASYSLLAYVSGINSAIAKNIVAYREEHGEFTSRNTLKKVPKLGDKVFLQCAGFLRIPKGKNPLDNTGIHPESYEAAEMLLDYFGYTKNDILQGVSLKKLCNNIKTEDLCKKLNIGEYTLKDIIEDLEKPGRDIRDDFPEPILRADVMDIKDLREGMEFVGTVRNVCDFGAFIDIGVHQDGMVHISQISDKFIKHPCDVLSVGDIVKVKILKVDADKKRIGLTMKDIK